MTYKRSVYVHPTSLRMACWWFPENVKAQLEGVTKEFKGYFDRMGQASQPDDLSGLLLSGKFAVTGNEVSGRWPLHPNLLKKLAGGAL